MGNPLPEQRHSTGVVEPPTSAIVVGDPAADDSMLEKVDADQKTNNVGNDLPGHEGKDWSQHFGSLAAVAWTTSGEVE